MKRGDTFRGLTDNSEAEELPVRNSDHSVVVISNAGQFSALLNRISPGFSDRTAMLLVGDEGTGKESRLDN